MDLYSYIATQDVLLLLFVTACVVFTVGWVAIEGIKFTLSKVKNIFKK